MKKILILGITALILLSMTGLAAADFAITRNLPESAFTNTVINVTVSFTPDENLFAVGLNDSVPFNTEEENGSWCTPPADGEGNDGDGSANYIWYELASGTATTGLYKVDLAGVPAGTYTFSGYLSYRTPDGGKHEVDIVGDYELVVVEAPAKVVVVINEFVAQPNVTQTSEWIELYNPNNLTVPLDGWTIENNTASPKNLTGKTVPANGYLVLNRSEGDFGFSLNDPGDIIILKNGTTEVDSVAYGSFDDGDTTDNAPKPGEDNSTGRYPNGQDTDVDKEDFIVFTSPTPGESNGVPEEEAPIIQFIEPTPGNNTEVNVNYVNVSVNVTDPTPSSGIDNMTVKLVWDGTEEPMTVYMYAFSEAKYYCEMTNLENGTYTYWVQANDTAGNMGVSETRVVTVNVTGLPKTGDMDGSGGDLNLQDVILLARHVLISAEQYPIHADGDVDSSGGAPDLQDVILLARHVLISAEQYPLYP